MITEFIITQYAYSKVFYIKFWNDFRCKGRI